MDDFGKRDKLRGDSRFREEVFSEKVRAGKRTYFFDVKVTRNDEHYLTITESKKQVDGERVSYEKHKIFLYKEDFEKFRDGLHNVISFIDGVQGQEEKEAEEAYVESEEFELTE